MLIRKQGARPNGLDAIVVDEDLSRRTRAFVLAVGHRRATALLGVGKATIEAAMERGRMQRATFTRLVEALGREERRCA